MAEFVQQDDREEPDVLNDRPCRRLITQLAGIDFVPRDEEPGEVEINLDPRDPKQWKRAPQITSSTAIDPARA